LIRVLSRAFAAEKAFAFGFCGFDFAFGVDFAND